MIENNILGVVLAGGKSKRFGDDKTTAKLGNKSLLDHTIEKIEKKFDEILIISNNEKHISIKKNNFFEEFFGQFIILSTKFSSKKGVSHGNVAIQL